MKNIYTLLLALMMTGLGFGQTTIAYQGFEENATDTWTTTFSTVPCSSGGDVWDYSTSLSTISPSADSQFWGISDLNGNCGSASGESITFSNTTVSGYTSISINFDYRVNGFDNNDDIFYTVSLDGIDQTEIQLVNGSGNFSTSGYETETINIPDGTNTVGLEVRVTQNGGDYAGLDNFILEGIAGSTCTAPTTQASAYNTTSIGTTSATLNWTDGDGDEVLVVVKEGSAVDTDPSNGTGYTGNTVFGSGDELGTGNYVVHSGSATSSVSITGLSEATTYHVAVYEYNTTDTCYELTELTGNFTTECSTPTDVTAFTATAGNTEVDLSWTNGTCYDEILIVAKASSVVTVTPTGDGTSYTANATFGSGTDLGTGEYAVYKGSGTSVTVTGLTNGTTYHFEAFARKATTWSAGVTDDATPDLTWCTVNGDTTYPTAITLVDFGSITKISGQGSGYDDFTSDSTDASQGSSIDLTVNLNTGGDYDVYAKAWIDWNQDGTFNTSTEEYSLGLTNNSTDGATSLSPLSITVPMGATLGNTRMRVVCEYDAYPAGPCAGSSDGEIEDYTINVTAPSTDTEVQFSTTSASVAETVGTYDLVIEIANEDAAATTFDVVLTSGDAADINSYTTQSKTFPGSSTTDVTVTITVTDDMITESDEVLTFEIQNVAGGNNAAVGANNSFNLTILASDAPTSGTLYDADFSNDGDGFPAHSSSSPPVSGPTSVGPFGSSFNQWTLSYNTTPNTDGGGNSFEVSGDELQSRDWGGQGIFTSQSINVSGVSSVDISATGLNVGANDGPFTYFYILDGGSRVETNVSSSNGNPVNYSIVGLDVSSVSTLEVGFEFSENGSNQGYDVSEFIVTAGCAAPTTQASAYNTTSLGTTSATLNWTSGNGDEVLVLVKEGSAVDADPDNGTSYTGNTIFTSGDQIGTGNYVVQTGSATSSVSITGLDPATTYYVAVYEYNTTDTCYLTPALTGDFTTDCPSPSDVTVFTAASGDTEVDLSWTNGSCYDDILIVAKATSAVTVTPTGDGTAYTANAAFGSGTDLGSNEYAVYKGTGTSVTVTGLTNGTTYHFEAFARKTTTWSAGVTDSSTPNTIEEAVAGDLIITEVSGDDSASGNDNGYMEIYNRSNKIINLDNLEARYFNSNPGNSTQEVSLSGTLSPGDFIIVTQNGGSYTTEYSDTADGTGSSFFFNGGDDGCDVYHTTNGVIDQFNDNGSGQNPWNWNDNFTYKRNSSGSGADQDNWTADGTNNNPRTKPNLYFWTGASDSSWATAGNWDEGSAPSSTTNVVITNQTNEPSITTSVDVANLTIETSTDVVVEKTGNLEISENLNNSGSLSLKSDSDEYSSLIIDGTSNGTITYDRHVNINGSGDTGSNDLISAPLTGQAFNNFATANPNILNNGTLYLFGPFEKSTGEYLTWAGTETSTLDAGVGYRAGTTDNGTVTFTGTANSGDVNVNITNSGPQEAEWNLVGNPYPSYINVHSFLNYEVGSDVTNLDLFNTGTGAIYGYDGTALDGWIIYNLATTTLSTVIAPGQGFFVSADASRVAAYDLEFTPAMRSTGTSDDFISGRNAELVFVKVNAHTNSNSYTTDFYFNSNASSAFDFGYDAEVWGGTTPDFAIYSHLVDNNQGKAMALQSLHASDLSNVTIPLGVHANQGEQLTFSIAESTLSESVKVYLDDVVANTSTLLNASDYVITPSSDLSGTGRFFLRTSNEALSSIEHNIDALNIYALNNSKALVISGQLQDNAHLSLYDIQGRKVLTKQLDNTRLENRVDASALSEGVYVVTVENNGQQKTQKVILK